MLNDPTHQIIRYTYLEYILVSVGQYVYKMFLPWPHSR